MNRAGNSHQFHVLTIIFNSWNNGILNGTRKIEMDNSSERQ